MACKVCIISEGSYPVVHGGVAEWTHQLINRLRIVDFDVFCVAPVELRRPLYERLPNIDRLAIWGPVNPSVQRKGSALPKAPSTEIFNCLSAVLYGSALDCERLVGLLRKYSISKKWLASKEYWNSIVEFYEKTFSEREFTEYFWTMYSLYSAILGAMALVNELPKADIYHSLTCGLSGLLGSLAKLMHGGKLVISEHGSYFKEREIDLSREDISMAAREQFTTYFETIVRTSYKYVDSLLPITRRYIDSELRFGAPQDKIRVNPVGIDCSIFTPSLSTNGRVPKVGCFARVVPVKDQMNLIRACKKVLEKQQANFVVIGEIQNQVYYRECQSLIQDLGIGGNFKFIGHTDNVLEWYHQVDVFVLSSQSEGIPLALLEAMSCGLACVCTAVGAIPDILPDNIGYIVPPNDPDSLAAKISELLENGTHRKEMGTRARELVIREYNIEKTATQILKAYQDLLSTKLEHTHGRANIPMFVQ